MSTANQVKIKKLLQDIPVRKAMTLKVKPRPEDYGFGKFFSDHMFIVDFDRTRGWHSPRITPYENLQLDPAAASLHYGQELFEGLKAYSGEDGTVRLFRPDFNWTRLNESAERLCMPSIDHEIMQAGLQKLLEVDRDWIPTAPQTSLYIRPTMIATEGFLGVRPADTYSFFIILSPSSTYYSEGSNALKIWVEDTQIRAAPGGLGAAKAGANYASSLKAAFEAKKRGFAQVLWLDAIEKKWIEEVGTMNVFFAFENEIVTPPLNGTILAGNTRACCIELLKSWGLPIVERRLEISEVLNGIRSGKLKEMWGTGTAAVIAPVSELYFKGEAYDISSTWGKAATKLYQTMIGIQYGTVPDDKGWTQKVF